VKPCRWSNTFRGLKTATSEESDLGVNVDTTNCSSTGRKKYQYLQSGCKNSVNEQRKSFFNVKSETDGTQGAQPQALHDAKSAKCHVKLSFSHGIMTLIKAK
jgi:hypothetical protein